MSTIQILILAIVQGVAELLPVSSSAHVIIAEKLMGLDPTSPQLTLLLVMLHTGTMFSMIFYFWKSWRETYFSSMQAFRSNVLNIIIATGITGFVGLALQAIIKRIYMHMYHVNNFEIEHLFGNLRLIAVALACAGLLIIVSSRFRERDGYISKRSAFWIGAVQGLCLPFRGFSRSGATISIGLAMGIQRLRAEAFSFALAVVLTPVVVIKEVIRLHTHAIPGGLFHAMQPGFLGMLFSFIAGLFALRWLSRWLEKDRWHFFGAYCLFAACFVLLVNYRVI